MDDEDYDPDHRFSIDSPGACFCMFIFFGMAMDPGDVVASQREEFGKLLGNAAETRFSQWGKYSGDGVHLKGRPMGLKGGVRIFSHSGTSNVFVVVQQYFDADLKNVQPGYDLIEKTFSFDGSKSISTSTSQTEK